MKVSLLDSFGGSLAADAASADFETTLIGTVARQSHQPAQRSEGLRTRGSGIRVASRSIAFRARGGSALERQ